MQFMAALAPSIGIEDKEERLEARKILTAPDGALTKRIQVIEKVLEGCGTPFYCGEQPSLADFRLYLWLSLVRSGCADICISACFYCSARTSILDNKTYLMY
jgi:glutathione S-transferase